MFLTGSRGEWGYIRPVIVDAQKRGHECLVVATNMHLSPEHGHTIKEIDVGTVMTAYMPEQTDRMSHATALGGFLAGFAKTLRMDKPDWLILAGDRGEQLMGAIAGAYSYIPTAHIQAGEVSGNIDNSARLAMAKLCHLHFAATEDCADRLRAMGEEAWRCLHVGAPQIDEMVSYTPVRPMAERFCLVVMHPTTDEVAQASQQILALKQACLSIPGKKVWIAPNNDPGWQDIYRSLPDGVTSNMPRMRYLDHLRYCDCIIGNSSSGILEAPTYGVPAVNIGNRQTGRERGDNVFDCKEWTPSEIYRTYQDAMRWKRVTLKLYGDGHSAPRIVDALDTNAKNPRLTKKEQTY
jgi:UDP-hydrolysing UDP-N-acetyl-D-glucosamine 2-epimerase